MPEAAHADSADTARSAIDAQTALNADNAIDAQRVDGYGAGCEPDTVLFAGACWQASSSFGAATAPQAALECAKQGGALPEALQLAAFAQQPSVNLDEGDEWSSDIDDRFGTRRLCRCHRLGPAAVLNTVFRPKPSTTAV